MMNESQQILQGVIQDAMQILPEAASPRDLQPEVLPRKVSICMGVRRCGKSTLLEGYLCELMKKGVPRENILWLNFMDDRLSVLMNGNWNNLYEAYYGLYPEKRRQEKVYIIFDEMQGYPQWELFIERMRREDNCDIFLTGSSSKLLSKEIGTSLRGRTLSWELFPFSFGETLVRNGIERTPTGDTTHRLMVEKVWREYVEQGGFPEVFGLSAQTRLRLHQEYFSSILYHDVVERNQVKQPLLLRQVAKRALAQTGSLFSASKTAKDFASMGFRIGRDEISEYMQWLEDAYFIIAVPPGSPSMGIQQRRMKKIYCVDHALAQSLGARITPNRGQLLENMVCVQLRRHCQTLYYYNTRQGYEVDFLAILPDNSPMPIQVCDNMADSTTRNREIRALTAAMAEIEVCRAWIITANHKETITTPQGTIFCIPAPEFLMAKELPQGQ